MPINQFVLYKGGKTFHVHQSFVITQEIGFVMITRPLVLVIICFGFFVLLQSLLPKVMAQKSPSRVNEFLLEDQRTRKRKNYVFRMYRDNKPLPNVNNLGTDYDSVTFQSDTPPEDLSAFIADYANMIRDDVILLDDSVGTRTSKRGNKKMKKLNQVIPDPPCNCEVHRETEDFGANSYPRYVETRNCSEVQQFCRPPYICKENLYELTIIRRRETRVDYTLEYPNNLPNEWKYKWIPEKRNITVGCDCTRNYVIEN